MDPSGWARLVSATAALVNAVGRLFGGTKSAAPSDAELLNQRQEQAAGAARNYSSRRTELAEAKRKQGI